MNSSQPCSFQPVVIVGAGMAGLSCALHLHKSGFPVRLFEASDDVGGRVRTDVVDGFLLDRGFQVYLDAYPETSELLDLKALELRAFEPGALVYKDGKLHRLMDIFRRPSSTLSSVLASVGSLLDKLRVGLMRRRILRRSLKEIATGSDQTTESYLRSLGFSEGMLDSFFRSFYGGIFLERELQTSSRMFEFTFKMFGLGSATLPAKGMGEIPRQIAAQLPGGVVELNKPARGVFRDGLELDDGTWVDASAVVVATNVTQAKALLPESQFVEPGWRSVTNIYFAAAESPVKEPIICLNGSGSGLVNNVCALTDAVPGYSPDGRALLSVSVLGVHEVDTLIEAVKQELSDWFGEAVFSWQHLRTDTIRQALPDQPPGQESPGYSEASGVYICGDHCLSASIEGAVVSGKRVASAVVNDILSSHV
ncbi:MAG: FAD-dependent oxidoreductase [Verrucomicrobiota bacterium]